MAVRTQAAEKPLIRVTAKELTEATRSWTLSKEEWKGVAEKADTYIRGLAEDAKKTLVVTAEPIHIAQHLEGEAGEVKEELLKENEDKKSHQEKVAGEICDTLYYLALLVDREKLGIWATDLWPEHWSRVERLMKFESDYKVADRAFFQCQQLAWAEEVQEHDPEGFRESARPELSGYASDALLLVIKLAERRGMDLDGLWKEAMERNAQRYLADSARTR